MKSFLINNKYILLLGIFCTLAIVVFCGHYNNILLDVGREVYYPEQILNGKVLYKDLFNIYGPFPYLFNAFLYKILGIKLGALYFAGIVSSYLLVFGGYILSRKYLSKLLSFCVGIFIIISGICAVHIFNYTLPYSYAMLYGAVGATYSVICLIKYKESNNTGYFYLSAFLGGFCVANKYDFILYGILLFLIALLSKNKKIILNFITCFMFVPILCCLVLFLQKLGMNDVINAISDIKSLIGTKSLEYFYSNQGILFNPKIFLLWLINILKTGICFLGLIFGVKFFEKNKIAGSLIFLVFAILMYVITTPQVLVFIAPLIILFMIFAYKNLKNNHSLLIFLLSALCISIKSFWAFLTLNYGNYFAPLLIPAFLAVLFTLIDRKYEKAVAVGLLVISLNTAVWFNISRSYLGGKISSDKGTIYTYDTVAESVENLVTVLKDGEANAAVIYPEGLLINFLTGIKSHDYYNSLLPVYSESLGDERIISNIEKFKPDYIVLSNIGMLEYGHNFIGEDYAVDFGKYLFNNYSSFRKYLFDQDRHKNFIDLHILDIIKVSLEKSHRFLLGLNSIGR